MTAVDVMIDCETLATGPKPLILSIGAALWDGKGVRDTFYYEIDASLYEEGFEIDPSTVLWWLKQSPEAQKRVLINEGDKMDLFDALARLHDWLPAFPVVWSNGASADIVWLESAYNHFNLKVPWDFWNVRCFRTLKELGKKIGVYDKAENYADGKKITETHVAVDDAIRQAYIAKYILQHIK